MAYRTAASLARQFGAQYKAAIAVGTGYNQAQESRPQKKGNFCDRQHALDLLHLFAAYRRGAYRDGAFWHLAASTA